MEAASVIGGQRLECVRRAKQTFTDAVAEAAEHYADRFGLAPELCLVSIGDGADVARCGDPVAVAGVGTVRLGVYERVPPGRLWLYPGERKHDGR